MTKKYEILVNRESVAIVNDIKSARQLCRKMCWEVNGKKLQGSKDVWSTGKSAITFRRIYE